MSMPIILSKNYNTCPSYQNMAFWYDASQLFGPNSTLPTNGATVNFWFDLSGNNNHLNTAASTFPIFNTNIQNGLPGVNFSASTHVGIAAAATNNVRTDVFHQFFAVSLISNTVSSFVSGPHISGEFRFDGADLKLFTDSNNSGGTNACTLISSGFIVSGQSVQFWGSTSQLGIIYAGTQSATSSISTTYNTPNSQLAIGNSSANQNIDGYILEAIGYNGSLNGTSQQTQILKYLQTKWSLT